MRLFSNKKKEHRKYTPPNVKQIPTEEYFSIIKEQLTSNGKATVRVTGVSMKPFLTPIRDTVEIVPPDDSIRRGDIVLFDTHCGRYVLHRVTRVGEKDFDMRGDNTVRGELKFPKAFLVGVVASATRNGRIIQRGAFLYQMFAIVSPAHYTWRTIWNKMLYPIASKIHHIIEPRKNGGENNA